MSESAETTREFERSAIGQTVVHAIGVLPDITPGEAPSEEQDPEQLRLGLLEVRALVARLRVLPAGTKIDPPAIDSDVAAALDHDLLDGLQIELHPDLAVQRERAETIGRLVDLKPLIPKYAALYGQIYKQIQAAKKLIDIYNKNRNLKPSESIAVVRQLSRLLFDLINWCDDEIENIHNQVRREKRGYRDSDAAILKKLTNYKTRLNGELEKIKASNAEVQIQLRQDQITLDSAILKRRVPKEVSQRREGRGGLGYIEVPSRHKLIVGDPENPGANIMAALRSRRNVELYGPTGTGKTKLAIHAAMLYSGKAPVVVPGNEGTGDHHFFGSPTGLDKRDDGAFIKCLKEGRVLIIDEDNRVRPEILASIKAFLGLKVGDVFIHPETGEEITVPPGFGIMVTRNEKGKHHKDRYDLPDEYRREYVHASFEVNYFTPQELYDRFLIPKLCKDDGSIDLSDGEIGGDVNRPDKRSPLLALAIAAEQIQDTYRNGDLRNGVFESGFLIELFDDWHEQHLNTSCKFLDYLETRLLAFTKRSLGAPNRKKLIEILLGQGFFRRLNATDFASAEGSPIEAVELTKLKKGNDVFDIKAGAPTLSAREVALLDPFGVRKIKVTDHPLKNKVDTFKVAYQKLCTTHGIRPVAFDANTLAAKRPAIVSGLKTRVSADGLSNSAMILALLDTLDRLGDEEFLVQIQGDIFPLFG